MKKPFPALCKDCKYSESDSSIYLRCYHPKVNAKDTYALGNKLGVGTLCTQVRDRSWPAVCGMRGSLWEPIKVIVV